MTALVVQTGSRFIKPMVVNSTWVEEAVSLVREAADAGDDEAAHDLEDALFHILLLAIADGTCSNAPACARAAVVCLSFDFQRWTA